MPLCFFVGVPPLCWHDVLLLSFIYTLYGYFFHYSDLLFRLNRMHSEDVGDSGSMELQTRSDWRLAATIANHPVPCFSPGLYYWRKVLVTKKRCVAEMVKDVPLECLKSIWKNITTKSKLYLDDFMVKRVKGRSDQLFLVGLPLISHHLPNRQVL